MIQKQEKSKNYFYHEGKTTLKNIVSYAEEQIPGLLAQVEQQGFKVRGPMEFIYLGATGDENKEFTLQIALPVEQVSTVHPPYKTKQTSEFKCVSIELKGSLDALKTTYNDAFAQIQARHIIPSGEIREVYHVFDTHASEDNITEIQIGIN